MSELQSGTETYRTALVLNGVRNLDKRTMGLLSSGSYSRLANADLVICQVKSERPLVWKDRFGVQRTISKAESKRLLARAERVQRVNV